MNLDKIGARATEAADREDWANAFALWQQADAKQRTRKTAIGMALAAENLANFEQAADLYTKALETWPKSTVLMRGLARVCENLNNWADAEVQWKALAQQHPNNAAFHIRIAFAQQQLGQYGKSVNTLIEAQKKLPDNANLLKVLQAAQFKYSDVAQQYDISLADLGSRDKPFIEVWRWFLERSHHYESDEFFDVLTRICETWPEKTLSRRLLAKTYHVHRHYDAAHSQYLILEKTLPEGDSISFSVAANLIALGRTQDAKAKLISHIAEVNDVHELQQKLGVFLNHASDFEAAAGVVNEVSLLTNPAIDVQPMLEYHRAMKPPMREITSGWKTKSEIIVNGPSTSGTAFLVFSGYGRMPGPVPIRMIDRFVAGHGAASILLSDQSAHLFQNGIKELGPDLDTTIARLKEILDDMNVTRVVTIGNSGGAFGALRYAAALNADNALIFSGPTNLQNDFMTSQQDMRARAVIRKLNLALSPSQLDMRAMLQASPHMPHIDMFYGVNNPGDCAQANYIADLPNVHLHPLENTSMHKTIGTAYVRGDLQKVLEQLLEAEAPESPNGRAQS